MSILYIFFDDVQTFHCSYCVCEWNMSARKCQKLNESYANLFETCTGHVNLAGRRARRAREKKEREMDDERNHHHRHELLDSKPTVRNKYQGL